MRHNVEHLAGTNVAAMPPQIRSPLTHRICPKLRSREHGRIAWICSGMFNFDTTQTRPSYATLPFIVSTIMPSRIYSYHVFQLFSSFSLANTTRLPIHFNTLSPKAPSQPTLPFALSTSMSDAWRTVPQIRPLGPCACNSGGTL